MSNSEPFIDADSARYPPVRPVVGFYGRQPRGYYDPPHAHDRAQFSYRLEGVAAVKAGEASIVVPPGRGVWVPAGVSHEVSCRGPAGYNVLYVTPAGLALDEVRVIDVAPFLHALIEEFLTFSMAYDEAGREGQVVRLMLAEIARAEPSRGLTPRLPQDPRLRRVCDAMRTDLADDRDIDTWAAVAGMSRRTFTRAFRAETGMGFTSWRRQLRMTEAIARLSAGASVAEVGRALGYSSASHFATIFQAAFGAPPSRYARD